VLSVSLAAAQVHAAVSSDCKKRAAAKASSLYSAVAKQFRNCAKTAAAGGLCSAGLRDAKVASKLARAQVGLLRKCTDADGTAAGFASADGLAVSVAGSADGEARQVVDSLYGRVPGALSADERACADKIAAEVTVAGKKTIKDMITCGTTPQCAGFQNSTWQVAELRASGGCTPAALASLVGGNLAAHMLAMRDGAERAAGALFPSFNPTVSVLAPPPGIFTPPGIPFNLDVSGFVANVPHAGYINSFEIDGDNADFDDAAQAFDHTVLVSNPGGTHLSIFLKARTTLGTVATTANINLNLGSLAPDVVITSPTSGVITNGGSITLSGQVIGDLSEADVLLVAGQVTTFNPVSGAWSRSVTLTSDPVQFIEAEVQSITLGTQNTDSIVVLKGTAWPLGLRVPNANFNRLNDSGFNDVEGIIQGTLNDAFAPAEFIGDEAAGGTICEFSTGTKTVDAEGAGANTVEARIQINNFHVKVCNIDTPLGDCDGTFDASTVRVTTQGNLEGVPPGGPDQVLGITISNTGVLYTGTSGDLSNGFFCDFIDAFFADVEADFEDALTEKFNEALPPAINGALGDIDISGSIGPGLDVDIDAIYTSIPEDSQGVTFITATNITALNPVPDAPVITNTLLPASGGNPILGPTIPSSGLTYDLAFCLSDGFVNRAMAAFMLQGMFNQSLTEVTINNVTLPLTTNLVGLVANPDDTAYQNDCFNCPATLVLKPTAAAVARAPEVGEGGTVTLIVPNYQVNVVADDNGTPRTQLTALVTFTLPVTLNVSGPSISVTTGTLTVNNVKVTFNPIGANEAAFVAGAEQLFPLAASALGDLFEEITLPTVQGLTVTGRGSDYNVSCAAIYMNLS